MYICMPAAGLKNVFSYYYYRMCSLTTGYSSAGQDVDHGDTYVTSSYTYVTSSYTYVTSSYTGYSSAGQDVDHGDQGHHLEH